MSVSTSSTSRFLVLVACAAAAGCGSFDGATQQFASSLAPYKIQVVQGNFISREQVDALRQGMSRQQVREVLGTPLVNSLFHGDRWDYVFTLKRQGVQAQERRLTVFFKGGELERFEGDAMPTEAEFVSLLDVKRRGNGTLPVLEASEERLRQYAPASPPAVAATDQAPPPASYPPLEAPSR